MHAIGVFPVLIDQEAFELVFVGFNLLEQPPESGYAGIEQRFTQDLKTGDRR